MSCLCSCGLLLLVSDTLLLALLYPTFSVGPQYFTASATRVEPLVQCCAVW